MSDTDVVTEIRALADGSFNFTSAEHEVLERAVSKIRELQEQLLDEAIGTEKLVEEVAKAERAKALEEAAQLCEARRPLLGQEYYARLNVESYRSACEGCAWDIRRVMEMEGGASE